MSESLLLKYLPRLILLVSLSSGSMVANVGWAQDTADPESPPAAGDAEPAARSTNEATAPEGAESEPPPAEDNRTSFLDSGAIGLLRKGGWFMWPILIMGIIAAGVIIERYRSLKMLNTDTAGLRRDVREMLSRDDVSEALAMCEREQGPVPAILSSGLRKFLVLRRLNYDPGRIEEQVVKAMDDYGVHVVAALERHLAVLATVSSAAPMLGFLGTVSGMITSFDGIQSGLTEGQTIVEAAAAGISEALLTTCFGLIVGIPAFVAFNYFTSIINRFVLDVEESATELIEVVTLQMALEQREPAEHPEELPIGAQGG